ncbi:MAG: hypothetical protein WC890_07675 [Candidatus Margulisiibacteriota bacterium]
MIAGEQGILLRKDGSGWDEELGRYRGAFAGVWGTGPDNMYIGGQRLCVDSYATILRCNGSSFTSSIETRSSYAVYGLWGTSANNVYVVGAYGTIMRYGP